MTEHIRPMTPEQAAAFVNMDVKAFMARVMRGEVVYVNLGLGNVRKRRRFLKEDLNDFLRRDGRWTAPSEITEETPPDEPGEIIGTVYFVGYGSYVKIGYATNLVLRYTALQVSCPKELKVFLELPGTEADEKFFHRKFAAHRLRGEWFRLSPEIKAWMKEVRTK